jgi:hypothetical protein
MSQIERSLELLEWFFIELSLVMTYQRVPPNLAYRIGYSENYKMSGALIDVKLAECTDHVLTVR